jgi:PAS domain S-box-containing protein
MPPSQGTTDEPNDLRRCVRDLVALSTLPAVWTNADVLGVADSLAEIFQRILNLDFCYVRVRVQADARELETARVLRGAAPRQPQQIGQALGRWLTPTCTDPPLSVPNPLGMGMVRLAILPIGHVYNYGFLVAASQRLDFPTQTERLLLGVGANQAAVVLQRKEAEVQLRRSEQELSDFFENASLGLHWVGPDSTILRANRAELELLGYAREEYVGHPIAEFHADPDVINDILRRLQTGEQMQDYEARLRCKDGSLKHVLINSNALWEEGRFVHTRSFTLDITDRRRAEDALQKQSEWWKVTLSSIGDAVITTDTQGWVNSLNPVAQNLTGWSQDEAQGQPLDQIFRIVNEPTRQPIENPALQALREDRIVELANHTLLIARDGPERVIDDSAAPIKDEQGNVLGVVLIFRDVTERRNAEQLRQHLAAVIESSDDAIVSKDLNGVIRTWNAGAQRIFGYTAEEMVGTPITRLMPPERVHEEDQILRELRSGRRVDHFETVRVRKDGRQIDVSVTISPVRNAEGRIIGASKVARDISDRKRAERTFRFLADASAVLAELSDYRSTLQKIASLAVPAFADCCAVDMLQEDGTLERLAVVHRDPAKVPLIKELPRRHPPRPDNTYGPLRVLQTGRSELVEDLPDSLLSELGHEEYLRVLRDLGLRSYLCVPLGSRGKALGVLTFATGESGRRYTPEELRAAEDLARRAVIAIENANLYRALQDSDRRKDEFLATLAHELRNPLAPVRNALQIIQLAGNNREAVQSAREMMGRQVQHMVRLIDDLLDLSRISRGKIQLRKELVELATVLHNAIETSRPLIEAARHDLAVTLPPTRIWLDADPTRLAQVVANLLNNAAKYTREGGRIWLSAGQEGDTAIIRVRDNGIGIPREMLPRIFDMFAQVDTALGRSQGGLGIGLTLVRSLVEMHHGTVEAQSEGAGKGSEFIVRLPVAAERLSIHPAQPQEGGLYTPQGAARRILVVDDNVDAAQSLGILLKMMGHDTALAHDGASALEVAEAYRPDLVLLDIGLPRLNGYEVARRLRQQPGLRDVVLVAVSGWGQEEDRRRGREAGFDFHLTKPVDPVALKKLLASLPAPKP